jgi:hypothetical protein
MSGIFNKNANCFTNVFGRKYFKCQNLIPRLVMDSLRTFLVWLFSLIVGWQNLYACHILGFVLMVSGMCVFNEIFFEPAFYNIRDWHRDQFYKTAFLPKFFVDKFSTSVSATCTYELKVGNITDHKLVLDVGHFSAI